MISPEDSNVSWFWNACGKAGRWVSSSSLPGLAQAQGSIQFPASASVHPEAAGAESKALAGPENCLPPAVAPELRAISTSVAPAVLGQKLASKKILQEAWSPHRTQPPGREGYHLHLHRLPHRTQPPAGRTSPGKLLSTISWTVHSTSPWPELSFPSPFIVCS